jgi:hypothetical protein
MAFRSWAFVLELAAAQRIEVPPSVIEDAVNDDWPY